VLQYACYYLHHNLWSEVTLNVLLLHLSVFGIAVQMPISLVVCLSQFVSFISTPYLTKMLHRIVEIVTISDYQLVFTSL